MLNLPGAQCSFKRQRVGNSYCISGTPLLVNPLPCGVFAIRVCHPTAMKLTETRVDSMSHRVAGKNGNWLGMNSASCLGERPEGGSLGQVAAFSARAGRSTARRTHARRARVAGQEAVPSTGLFHKMLLSGHRRDGGSRNRTVLRFHRDRTKASIRPDDGGSSGDISRPETISYRLNIRC